jgi:hypothetical protein
MSQFRIKNIDNALVDEWIPKVNDGISIVGDDIDARDPNELSDAIFDTQTIILKTSTLVAGDILKPNSGLAERITILEAVAGNSTLQDVYTSGNTISVLAGKPLTFGIGDAFKLDDIGNLSFKPTTMKVRGTGFATLDFTNASVTTTLGDLLVGATSPTYKLTLRSENHMYLKDVYLTNAITLSEPGQLSLDTASQSLVGAINELNGTAFNSTLQSNYDQSSPPKITTNIIQGSFIVEDPNPLSVADALRVIGYLTVTKKARVGDLKVGVNTTIADTTGYITSDPITTTNQVKTPHITSGTSDLQIQDKRVSFPFSDVSVTDLSTTKKSVIGAINELKSDVTAIGLSSALFGNQHNSTTGVHEIITTQAGVGANSTKRLIIKNSSAVETFSINGLGDLIANSAVVSGLNVVTLLNQLVAHIANDGTEHSAFAGHLLASNPHNTVKSLFGLGGVISLTSPDGSVSITNSGNTINIQSINTKTLQDGYDNLVTKQLLLGATGLTFKDSTSGDTQLVIRPNEVAFKKHILLEHTDPEIISLNTLNIEPTTDLTVASTTGDISIKALGINKIVTIQDIPFNEIAIDTLPSSLGASVLGAFDTINNNFEFNLSNASNHDIDFMFPHFVDSNGDAWPHIANFHSANEFLSEVDFYWANNAGLYYPKSTVLVDAVGTFYSSGTHEVAGSTAISLPSDFHIGAKVYPINLSYSEIQTSSAALMVNDDTIEIDGVIELIGKTVAVPDLSLGHFRIEQTGDNKIKTDYTRDNIIATINSTDLNENSTLSLKAGIWGNAPKATIAITGTVANNETFTIDSSATTEGISVVFTAKTTPSGWLEFQASTNVDIATASLVEVINRAFFRDSLAGTNGHRCKAVANGSIITLEYYKPGLIGELVALSTSSANITAGTMTGGTSVFRIYDMKVSNITSLGVALVVSGSGLAIVTGANFIDKEKADEYFLTASEALSSTRYSPQYKARELGTIEAVIVNLIKFKIKG